MPRGAIRVQQTPSVAGPMFPSACILARVINVQQRRANFHRHAIFKLRSIIGFVAAAEVDCRGCNPNQEASNRAHTHRRGDDTLNFLLMLGTAQYWARVCVAAASAAAMSLDAFGQRLRAAQRAIFFR